LLFYPRSTAPVMANTPPPSCLPSPFPGPDYIDVPLLRRRPPDPGGYLAPVASTRRFSFNNSFAGANLLPLLVCERFSYGCPPGRISTVGNRPVLSSPMRPYEAPPLGSYFPGLSFRDSGPAPNVFPSSPGDRIPFPRGVKSSYPPSTQNLDSRGVPSVSRVFCYVPPPPAASIMLQINPMSVALTCSRL